MIFLDECHIFDAKNFPHFSVGHQPSINHPPTAPSCYAHLHCGHKPDQNPATPIFFWILFPLKPPYFWGDSEGKERNLYECMVCKCGIILASVMILLRKELQTSPGIRDGNSIAPAHLFSRHFPWKHVINWWFSIAVFDYQMVMLVWLVVGPPLWKIWKSIGMIIPNIWEKNGNQNTNQMVMLVNISCCWNPGPAWGR